MQVIEKFESLIISLNSLTVIENSMINFKDKKNFNIVILLIVRAFIAILIFDDYLYK